MVVLALWLTAVASSVAQPEVLQLASSEVDQAAGDDQPGEERETEVTLRDGRKISGILIEITNETIFLRVGGVRTPLPRASAARIDTLPTQRERYESLRRVIDENDSEALERLAEWLRSRRMYTEAHAEVLRALAADPGNLSARQLRVLIEEQIKLAEVRGVPRQQREAAPGPAARPAASPQTAAFPLLTDDDINLMRVYEVDLANPPRMVISRQTIERFLDEHAGTPVAGRGAVPETAEGRALFLRSKPADVLGWMFAVRARDYYGQVRVMANPPALQAFRDDINRGWLVNGCATSRCHGGEEAGRLWLYDKRPMSDASAMTNLLILERFKTSDGRPLINYEDPASSPLLQLGLPHSESSFKHPEVKEVGRPRWRPVFTSRNDDKFQRAVRWMRSMYQPRPEYPIDYTPPVPRVIAEQPEPEEAGATPPR
jgi:hypothetical protein